MSMQLIHIQAMNRSSWQTDLTREIPNQDHILLEHARKKSRFQAPQGKNSRPKQVANNGREKNNRIILRQEPQTGSAERKGEQPVA